MELLADRFVLGPDATACDLSTGEKVVVTLRSAGGESEQRRWALACDAYQMQHHPATPRLVDYGAAGESRRFEAHASPPPRPAAPGDHDVCGLAHIPRREVAAIAELLRVDGSRPQVTALWGPKGSGKRTAVAQLARLARLEGIVPIAADLLPTYAELLNGRRLLIIDDSSHRRGWTAWLAASLEIARPHVLLLVGEDEPVTVSGLGLEPVSVASLIGAVRPEVAGGPRETSVRRMAEQSQGWPGRFSRLLGCHRHEREREAVSGLRAAEPRAAYGVDQPVPLVVTSEAKGVWAVPGELTSLRRRLETGRSLVAAGRHAPGERALRQAVGGLARRHDWPHAAEGAAALAETLLRRGRARDAQEQAKSAAEYWRRAGDEARLIDAAILGGLIAIDLARLDEAETTLAAAVAAARSLDDEGCVARAMLALARTLFWGGRYDEAEQTLQLLEVKGLGVAEGIAGRALRAMVAVGRRAFDDAVSQAMAAVEQARGLGNPGLTAEACLGAAFAHVSVGDVAAVERDVAAVVTAARASHQPLMAMRARLILADAMRRSGRRASASAILRRISRVTADRIAPIDRARCQLQCELLARTGAADDLVARHASGAGLAALALFAAPGEMPKPRLDLEPVAGHLLDVLGLCQTSQDERVVLGEVCRRVRVHLRAVAAAFTDLEAILASDGGRINPEIATRAIAAGVALPPHQYDGRVEAASPVRYGGATIGVLVVRWTIASPHDLAGAASLMTTVAAVAAPILSAAIERRRRLGAPPLVELMGASAPMVEVLHGVERAAAAPFAVLIEGESGCGKELVARALHRAGPRRDRPFCTLNCAALPDDLVETELFGHARGAFTGAVGERAGVFEDAHGGTLLLDEIAELSPRAQAKLLRVIQEGELRRIGENIARRIDVRIVSATNRNLREEAAAGRFRLDLLYRLDVVRITVPPLRERREDIPMLAGHYWQVATSRLGSRATLSAATHAALARYDWPGNVRELQNVLASLAVRSGARGVVPPTALGPQFSSVPSSESPRLDRARQAFEDRFVRAALARAGGHRTQAAQELGVTRQGLAKLMTRLRIEVDGKA